MGGIARKARRQALREAERRAPSFDANDLGLPKMSQILLHVAEPMLADIDLPEQVDDCRAALMLATAVWNISRLPTEEQRREQLEELLNLGGERMPPEMEAIIRTTFRRARTLHPYDPRIIAKTDLYRDDEGGYQVTALASLPVPKGVAPE